MTYQPLLFIPTPEQIAAECNRIQAGWSEHQEQSRRKGSNGTVTAELQVVSTQCLLSAMRDELD